MFIYNIGKLESDVNSKKISYVICNCDEIKEKEQEQIKSEKGFYSDQEILESLKTNISERFKAIEIYYPKTCDFLQRNSLEYKVFLWWADFSEPTLFAEGYFVLNNRVYFVKPRSFSFNLPSYLQTWYENIGGIVCSDHCNSTNGRMLIDDAWLWHSFDEYIVKNKKKVIEHIVNNIPYTFVDEDEDKISVNDKHLKKGFPNLRCFLDTRMPFDSPEDVNNCKEYDLLFICYDFNETVYLVKDGDFFNGLYTIDNPSEALDNYMLHVFSQYDQEFTRFDFSPWMKGL